MQSNERRSDPLPAPAAGPAASERRSWASPALLAGLFLLLAIIVTYQPVGHAGYLWDDDALITENPCIVGPLGLKEVWTTRAADICPLTITTFWVEHRLWGLVPLPYHLVNVLLHAACALLLWRVLLRLQVPGAWLGAALWALHPVQVESVAWIVELKNTQSGVFFLLAIFLFLQSLPPDDRAGRPDRGWLVALTWLCAALAMASKTATMVLPVVLGLLARWQEGRWHRRTLREVGPLLLLSLAAAVFSLWTQWVPPAVGGVVHAGRTGPQRLAAAGDAVWFYLGKLAWPHPLMMVYPRWEIDARQWWAFLPLAAVIAVSWLLWRQRRAWRTTGALLAWACFLVALLPVLGVVEISDFHHSFVFDHFLYLASMGPLALAGAGIACLPPGLVPGGKWWPPALGAALLLALGLASWQRTWVYKNQETLWRDTLAKNPRCWVGHDNLGLILLRQGHADEATVQFQEALRIDPDNALSHTDLGNALRREQRLDEAIVQYQEALRIDPRFIAAHNNFGVALRQQGRVDEAIAQYQEALESDPINAQSQSNLGNAFLQKGQVDEAIAHYREALRIDPDTQNHDNLGNALAQEGRLDEALTQYVAALEIDPDRAFSHNGLGIVLARRGQLDEAVAQFQEAVRLQPDYREAQQNLATAQRARQQTAGARFPLVP